jgi:hypothetical protein
MRSLPSRTLLLFLGLSLLVPATGAAQGFVAVWVGGATDADASNGGTELAYALQLGYQAGLFGFGAEVGQQENSTSSNSDLLGGFVRVAAPIGRLRPFATGGLGFYRFAPSGVFDNSKFGGSVGGGLLVDIGLRRMRVAAEARYHAVFSPSAGLSRQRFVTVMGGVQLSF